MLEMYRCIITLRVTTLRVTNADSSSKPYPPVARTKGRRVTNADSSKSYPPVARTRGRTSYLERNETSLYHREKSHEIFSSDS